MNPFIGLGTAIIIGVLMGKLMNKIKIPAVAGYIIAGLVVGTSGLRIINPEMLENLSFLSDFALCIIAFNIGSELELSVIKVLGKSIFIIAFCEAICAFILVGGITYLITKDVAISLILGAVSSATAPAATVMVLKEFKAKGPLTSTLLGVVAVDDAICLIIYSMAAAIAKVFINHEVITINKVLLFPIREILISIAIGGLFGILLSYFIRISKRENELLPFIIGILLVVDGVSTVLHLSPLLTSMSLGIMVANIAVKKEKAFASIESFSPPIIAAFFILAGSRLNIAFLPQIGLVGVAYFVFRIIGKLSGASLGAAISHSPTPVKKYIGLGLLSQVGVAVGLAITVSREFPGTPMGTLVVTILLSTTIFTEIVGPIATRIAIFGAKEANI
jgi:Kef-type K+ transport system membrane component KefB